MTDPLRERGPLVEDRSVPASWFRVLRTLPKQ